ncbi:MAG: SDR family oxidoreductase, partial [Aliifodinibius sp.]|nr:SDR family oxidoreductase [Fodinibius sp.]NIV10517.1 SDR family oxidoreductase [Fodinibius sp.]NIY25702.1 SDR family oxidoreductase [Fodinibius sp.]
CNAIAPGYIETEMTDKLDDKIKENLRQQIPLARIGEAEDVAKVVTFLASDGGSYITGQVINVDGGLLIG